MSHGQEIQSAIVIRERRFLEAFDLAFLICRVYRRHIIWAAVPGTVLIILAAMLMRELWLDGAVYLCWLLLIVLAPLITMPITATIGQLLFFRSAGPGEVWRMLRRQSALLFWMVFGIRFLLALPVIGMLFHPFHMQEIILLEQQDRQRSWRRVRAMGRSAETPGIAWYSLCIFLFGIVLIMLGSAASATIGMFVSDWDSYLSGREESLVAWYGLVAVWILFQMYWAVLRFVAYIDQRTRSEGWALEKRLRAVAEEWR